MVEISAAMTSKIAPGELMNEVNALTRERDELRAVNKVLQLRGDTYLEQLEQKHAENKRLRAALKTIGSAADWHPDDMQAFARAACQT